VQLIAADVEGVDAPCAARNQDLREAAGRGADVETDATKRMSAAASFTPPRDT
jgi:hypothetical protein